MTTHEVLVAARNLIDRGGWAHRGHGDWTFERVGARCALNAITNNGARACSEYTDPVKELGAAIGCSDVTAAAAEIPRWNDTPGRTKAEVLAAFDEAIAATAPEPFVELEVPVEVPA